MPGFDPHFPGDLVITLHGSECLRPSGIDTLESVEDGMSNAHYSALWSGSGSALLRRRPL